MKKLTIILALAVAAICAAEIKTHPNTPVAKDGQILPVVQSEWPIPTCPPSCIR